MKHLVHLPVIGINSPAVCVIVLYHDTVIIRDQRGSPPLPPLPPTLPWGRIIQRRIVIDRICVLPLDISFFVPLDVYIVSPPSSSSFFPGMRLLQYSMTVMIAMLLLLCLCLSSLEVNSASIRSLASPRSAFRQVVSRPTAVISQASVVSIVLISVSSLILQLTS